MTPEVYHGVVRGGAVHLDAGSPLPDGTKVLVVPAAGTPAGRGSPAALLAALKAAPPVPAEWVDELDQFIEQGRRPPMRADPFAGEPGGG